MAHNKRLAKAAMKLWSTVHKNYALTEAVALAKANAKAKFDETIEISLNLGIDPRHADQMVRGLISLPNGTGKVLRVGVFARNAKADEALGRRRRRGGRRGPGRKGAGRRNRSSTAASRPRI